MSEEKPQFAVGQKIAYLSPTGQTREGTIVTLFHFGILVDTGECKYRLLRHEHNYGIVIRK